MELVQNKQKCEKWVYTSSRQQRNNTLEKNRGQLTALSVERFYTSFWGLLYLAVRCEPRLPVEDRNLTFNDFFLQIMT